MKYPIKGVPEDKVIRDIEIEDFYLYVSYLRGKRECLSIYDHDLVREHYMRQLNYFVNDANGFEPDLFMFKLPTLFLIGGVVGSFLVSDMSMVGSGIGMGTSIVAGVIQNAQYKESKLKHQIVRDHFKDFCARFEDIKEKLGPCHSRKLQEPEDIIFAVDDMPKKLVLEIGGVDKKRYKKAPYNYKEN